MECHGVSRLRIVKLGYVWRVTNIALHCIVLYSLCRLYDVDACRVNAISYINYSVEYCAVADFCSMILDWQHLMITSSCYTDVPIDM